MEILINKNEWPERMRLAIFLTAHGGVLQGEFIVLKVEDLTEFLRMMWHCYAVCSRKSYPVLMRMRYLFYVNGVAYFMRFDENDKCIRYGYHGNVPTAGGLL